jgi:DNA-binding SARP family transcriptional activator
MAGILQQMMFQQFRERKPSARIMILHPNYKGQHTLLPAIFAALSPVIYVRLTGTAMALEALRTQVEVTAPDQGSLAEAACLIVDESDRADDEALAAYLSELLGQSGQIRVVLLGRRMPLPVAANPRLREQSCLFPVAPHIGLPDYSQLPAKNLLEVYALGAGQVILNGRRITNWDGTLPRALFFYLVDRGMVTRSEIFETFWPSLSVKEATNVFHVTKRKVNEVLGIELTEYKAGFYHIAGNIELVYDTSLFSELVQQSHIAGADRAQRLLTEAVTLYKGRFLCQMTSEWTNYRRQQMIQDYGDAMLLLAKLVENEGDLDMTLGLYLRALETNRRREDVVRSIMELYLEREMHAAALAVYERLAVELDRTLGVSPAPILQRLKETAEVGNRQPTP